MDGLTFEGGMLLHTNNRDVFSTVRQHGYPIGVLSEYSQAMNRCAFLLIA